MELTMDIVRKCAQTAIQSKAFVVGALECGIMNTKDDLANADSLVSDLLRSEDAVDAMHDDAKSALGSGVVDELNRLSVRVAVSRGKVATVAWKMRVRVKWLEKELEKING